MKHVLVSGGSIAGATLAYWLGRHGFKVTLVERAPRIRAGGHAIDIRGTARTIVERMGLMPAIRAAHTGTIGTMFVDHRGRKSSAIPSDRLGDSGSLIADLEIVRGDMVKLLYDLIRDTVEILFDDSIATLRDGPDAVDVSFEKAGPRRFDLVVGADGLHSRVRALRFGLEAQFTHDLGAYIALFDTRQQHDLQGWEMYHTVPLRTLALYPKPNGEARAMFLFKSAVTDEDPRRLIARRFADVGWEGPRLLKELETAADLYFDRLHQIRMERWSDGRVVLLGDAAFCATPVSGNGSSLAIVGAHVLAGELSRAGHATAFARYEEAMRGYVTRTQAYAETGVRHTMPPARWHIMARDFFFRSMRFVPNAAKMMGMEMDQISRMVPATDYLGEAPRPDA